MRKVFAALILAVLIPASGLKAQEVRPAPSNYVCLSYGEGSMVQFSFFLGASLAEAFTAGHADIKEVRTSGSFTIGYARAVKKWLWVGGEFCYENCMIVSSGDRNGGSSGGANAMNLMGACRMSWFDRQHFAMYSKLCAGAILVGGGDSKASPGFAFQVSPVCLEAGGERFRGFMECGWGVQSLLAAGVRYRF